MKVGKGFNPLPIFYIYSYSYMKNADAVRKIDNMYLS